MKTKTVAVIAGLSAMTAIAQADFTFIDFGPQLFQSPYGMVALTDQLEDMGVRFSSLMPNDNVYWDGGSGLGIPFSIYGRKPPRQVGQNSEFAMMVEFTSPTTFASITAYDSGGDLDTVVLEAFNAQGSRVDIDSVTSRLANKETLIVEGEGITHMTITVTSPSGRGAFIDDLFFTTFP